MSRRPECRHPNKREAHKLCFFSSTKDKTQPLSQSNVVYEFTCPGCHSSYIGKTNRTLLVRTQEHARSRTDKYKHVLLASIKNTIILFVCPSKILHKHCFQFLLGPLEVPRENKNNPYAKLTAKIIASLDFISAVHI